MDEVPVLDASPGSLVALEEARSSSWAVQSPRGLEVLRYAEGRSALSHPQFKKGATFQRRLEELGVEGPVRDYWNRIVTTTEGEARKRLRAPLIALFRASETARLEVQVRRIIEDLTEEIAGNGESRVDLMQSLAWEIPSRVYCHLISAPLEFAPQVARMSESTLSPLLTNDRNRRQESIAAFLETRDFVKEHIDFRRSHLGDDFTSRMIRLQLEEHIDEEDLIAEAMSILQASIDNTAHQVGLTLGTLLEAPERWHQLCQQPELIDRAVEESLRLRPRFNTIFRHVPEPTEFNNVPLSGDSWVFVSVRSAQRDPEAFRSAGTYRLDRKAVRPLLFGGGPYNCLGQHLARLEIRECVLSLLQRFPHLTLDEAWSCHETDAVTEVTALRAMTRR